MESRPVKQVLPLVPVVERRSVRVRADVEEEADGCPRAALQISVAADVSEHGLGEGVARPEDVTANRAEVGEQTTGETRRRGRRDRDFVIDGLNRERIVWGVRDSHTGVDLEVELVVIPGVSSVHSVELTSVAGDA